MKLMIVFVLAIQLVQCKAVPPVQKDPNKDVPKSFSTFQPIKPSYKDTVTLAKGFTYQVLISYGDTINPNGDTFGFNNDHIEYFPIDGLKGGRNPREGYLYVNHEYYGKAAATGKTLEIIEKEKYAVGGSILKVKKGASGWKVQTNDPHNRRITAKSPIRVEGPAKTLLGDQVIGTMANCSGGQTPWGTVLSGEESLNYGDRNGWPGFNPKHCGWMVEIDPYKPNSIPVKQTALGRMRHENAAIAIAKDGRIVVYMGEDSNFGGFYKFISKGKYIKDNRENNLKLLSAGQLYGARVSDETGEKGTGKWIPIDINDPVSGPKLRKAGYKNQAEVLIDTYKLNKILGISGLDRPEDCEVHPKDGSIYLSLTGNYKRSPPNFYGAIWRFIEGNNDPLSLTFKYETFAKGGEKGGFANPDNLAFDKAGNLWMVTDMSSFKLNRMAWKLFKNNGMFMFKTTGSEKGVGKQFASGPNGSELSGLWFSPDETTLFVSVMHPGEKGNTSTWPPEKNGPKPSVIAIRIK